MFMPYTDTSPPDVQYNCIAWTFHEQHRPWWPTRSHFYFWPDDIPREETIDAFIRLYVSYGYSICDDLNENLESGYQKIAIYVRDNKPTHAARQLPSGNWTSKISDEQDVEHSTLDDLPFFGHVQVILKKPLEQ